MYTFFEVSKKEMRWVGRFLGRSMYLKFETHSPVVNVLLLSSYLKRSFIYKSAKQFKTFS